MAEWHVTKRKLVKIFGPRILSSNDNIKHAAFAAMDGDNIYLERKDKPELISKLSEHLEKGDYKLAMVPVAADKTIFFADVDEMLNKLDLESFLSTICNQFNALISSRKKDVTPNDLILFKKENKNDPRYHVYIPDAFGCVTKNQRETIYVTVNDEMGFDIIDTAAKTIRIEGFEKFDNKDTKLYLPGSRYLPIGDAKDLSFAELLELVWIEPRGWNEKTDSEIASRSLQRAQDLLNDAQNGAVARARRYRVNRTVKVGWRPVAGGDEQGGPEQKDQSQNDTVSESENVSSREKSVDFVHKSISPKVEEQIKIKFSEVAHVLLKYPIKSVKSSAGGHTATFMFDKSATGRLCPIANKVHKRNNTYLRFERKRGIIWQQCMDPDCAVQRKPVLLYKLSAIKKNVIHRNLPSPNEVSLAQAFVDYAPLVRCEKDGKNYTWFVFKDDPGLWKTTDEDEIMHMLMGPFRKHLEKRFDAAIDEGKEDEDQLLEDKKNVLQMLSSIRNLENIKKGVRWHIAAMGKKIEWNSKTTYTVFPNGVLQLDKRHEEYPELPYYFGKTKPDEYINDRFCMKRPFNCPPVCFDGHYITEADRLRSEWLDLIQPNPDDQCLLLMFLSLVLLTVNYKKTILNIGPSGDNAKSSWFEMVVNLLGSYGIVGDKNLIVKGGTKDRVAKAILHMKRFVLFEEPDAAKHYDTEFMKDIVGGAIELVARMNFSNKTVIKLHLKTVLNANTMTAIQLEEAIMKRILYLSWTTVFTDTPALVDHANRIYLADPKFKTPAYFDSINDGFIWLLLQHHKLFVMNGNKLRVTPSQLSRTKAELLRNDPFYAWFKSNYVFLTDTAANQRKFVTFDEVIAEFRKLTPAQQLQIIGKKDYAPDKFIRDTLKTHNATKAYAKDKVTNWRITAVQRMLPGAKNKSGPNKQYRGWSILRFVTRAEFEAGNFDEQEMSAPASNDTRTERKTNEEQDAAVLERCKDGDLLAAAEDLPADYLLNKDLFYHYRGPYAKDGDDDEAYDNDNDFVMVNQQIGAKDSQSNEIATDNDLEIVEPMRAASIDVDDDTIKDGRVGNAPVMPRPDIMSDAVEEDREENEDEDLKIENLPRDESFTATDAQSGDARFELYSQPSADDEDDEVVAEIQKETNGKRRVRLISTRNEVNKKRKRKKLNESSKK